MGGFFFAGFEMFLKKRNHAQLMAMQGPPTPPHSDSEVEGEEQKRGGRTDAILAKVSQEFMFFLINKLK